MGRISACFLCCVLYTAHVAWGEKTFSPLCAESSTTHDLFLCAACTLSRPAPATALLLPVAGGRRAMVGLSHLQRHACHYCLPATPAGM